MNCALCPRNCGVDRKKQAGFCGAKDLKIARADLHFYEEPPLSGTRGSGAVFFSGCSLRCVFCQNFEVSRGRVGKTVTPERLAEIFRELEEKGAHNLNLVTPTHYLTEIERAFEIYRPKIPVVWNTHAYETEQTVLRAAEISDVFLPDLKFYSPEISLRYAGVPDYFEKAFRAVKLMRTLKADRFDADGMLRSGVLIRHLILPMNADETFRILDAVARELPGTKLSLMSQYTPFGEHDYPELKRRITAREYNRARAHMQALGIDGYVQSLDSSGEVYIPNWNLND